MEVRREPAPQFVAALNSLGRESRVSGPDQQSPGQRLAARVVQEQQRRQAEAPASKQEVQRGFQSIRQELYETQRWLREALVRLSRLERAAGQQETLGGAGSDGFRREALRALLGSAHPAGLGLRLDGNQQDKYAVAPAAPDCEARLPVCRAVCCHLPFPLSRQDVDEGELAWSQDYPFQMARAPGSRCVHLDPAARRCAVYDKRPRICRAFDCRADRRVWQDYEQMILTPWAEKVLGQAPSAETDAPLVG